MADVQQEDREKVALFRRKSDKVWHVRGSECVAEPDTEPGSGTYWASGDAKPKLICEECV